MTTKQQLKNQFSRYKIEVKSLPEVNKIKKYKISLLSDANKVVAKCTICKHKSDDTWNMGDSSTKIKGIGKFLYYGAMNFVFPAFVSADVCGCSNSAIRVWQALEKVDFVESVFQYKPHWELDPEDNDNYSSIKCRFSW